MDRKHVPTTHSEARDALKGRPSRTICNNTSLVDLGREGIGLRLHGTHVVILRLDDSLVLNSGGWQTVTTKDRINRVIRAHGWNLYADRRVWYVENRDGRRFEFEDGFTILPPAREHSRPDHCTHPERDICDCDWCRFLRSKPQVRVENHGTIWLVRPLVEPALAWLSEHTDGTWLGNALAVEHRYVGDLVFGLRNAGFQVAA